MIWSSLGEGGSPRFKSPGCKSDTAGGVCCHLANSCWTVAVLKVSNHQGAFRKGTDLVLAEEIGPSSTPPLLGSFVVPNSQNLPHSQTFSIGSHRQRCSSRVFNPGPEPPVGASSQVAGLLREDGMGCQVPQLLVPADHTSGQWGFSLIADSPGPGSLKMVMSAVFRSIAGS